MGAPIGVECVECGNQGDGDAFMPGVCQACSSDWLEPRYDYVAFKQELLRGLPDRPMNLWRYHEVLPIADPASLDLADAGGTPMVRSWRFARGLELGQIFIKDERYGPTASFKDRQAAVVVAAMMEAGVRECVIASTGNAAVAYAAACARAGIKLWVFMTSLVPQEKLREAALFGAEVIRVSGTYDQAKQIAAEFAARRGLFLERGVKSLPARESMKTIAYEIVEQLGWRAPDWYVQSVSGGLGPLGVYHGFRELYAMGLIDRMPKTAVIQVEGCSPMVQAFKEGLDVAKPVVPQTRIAILSTGDPGVAYTRLWRIIERHGGVMESVRDEEAFAAMHALARAEGMAVEPATAVAFAGLEKLVCHGQIDADELVVVNCSGHTFPVEKHVLGDQWRVDFHLNAGAVQAPREGLRAALEHLDEKTTTVLLVDDNPDDSLLIRRLLEARKAYRVYLAQDGVEGLRVAHQRLPDLIIADLMMPKLDGFGFISALKSDERTHHVPVIVVSAKDMNDEERRRLNGYIEAVYQKGRLPSREFVDQVIQVLGER